MNENNNCQLVDDVDDNLKIAKDHVVIMYSDLQHDAAINLSLREVNRDVTKLLRKDSAKLDVLQQRFTTEIKKMDNNLTKIFDLVERMEKRFNKNRDSQVSLPD